MAAATMTGDPLLDLSVRTVRTAVGAVLGAAIGVLAGAISGAIVAWAYEFDPDRDTLLTPDH
jgi:hypothetical protein